MSTETLRRTPLYDAQRELGARFMPFHGWDLPVSFTSIIAEHEAVRCACGVFDVSHMGQITVSGPGALELIQAVNSNDASRLAPGRAMYSHMLNERGGIIDDVIVSRLAEDRFFIVVNASTADKDFRWISDRAEGFDVRVQNRSEDYGMIALQGPRSAQTLKQVSAAACGLERFGAAELEIFGSPVVITRTGYTGEDGFEIIALKDVLLRFWRTLLAQGQSLGIAPCGLGARDTLRLEAGLMLYGADIDEDHTPLEAGCGWVVKFSKKGFIGKEALERQKRDGLLRKLYGLRLLDRGVPRAGSAVFVEGRGAGALSSGTYSPTLRAGLGLGYLDRPDLESGRAVEVELHGRRVPAEIARMPFYKPS